VFSLRQRKCHLTCIATSTNTHLYNACPDMALIWAQAKHLVSKWQRFWNLVRLSVTLACLSGPRCKRCRNLVPDRLCVWSLLNLRVEHFVETGLLMLKALY
jgi:hypothetical protein